MDLGFVAVSIFMVWLGSKLNNRFGSGLQIGGIFFFIGSLFGGDVADNAFLIGFILGLFIDPAQENKDKPIEDSIKDNKSKPDENSKWESKSKPDDKTDSTPFSEKHQLFRCPSCSTKIRVKVPLNSTSGKCANCSSLFSLEIDPDGFIKAEMRGSNNTENSRTSTDNLKHYFEVLGLDIGSPPSDVRKAYLKKISEYHPDKVSNLGVKLREIAEAESKNINIAYSALKSAGLAK